MTEHWDRIIWEREKVFRHRFGRYLTQDQLIMLSGASLRIIERMVSLGLIDRIWVNGAVMYHTDYLPRVRKMLRLRYDLGVGWASMCIVLNLLDRIEELERNRTQSQP